MIFPYIELTQVYADQNAEKHERPLFVMPENINSFTHFEIVYFDEAICVKQDCKEIKKRILSYIKKAEKEDFESDSED